ncbi:helix-turn-helix domain-containing protein [Methanolobus sp. ZRKC2]|uniref:winged helix-turn-helix transcriptional regulator n=1 Tax=Methanolobus sp. ZRKC2 TaxID=3125783 RepID=UPI003243F658
MQRSDCPIANILDYVGDKWTLLILRDILLFNKKTYSDLQNSKEHIATNILADRLNKLENAGIIYKSPHPNDKRRSIYSSTEKGFDLIPLLLEMVIWSKKYAPETYAPEDFLLSAKNNRDELIQMIIDKNKKEQV